MNKLSRILTYTGPALLLLLSLGFTACKAEAGNSDRQDDTAVLAYQPDMQRLLSAYERIREYGNAAILDTVLLIDGKDNKLFLVNAKEDYLNILKTYDISASKYGFGSARGSNQTPPGVHRIAGKYGHDQPLGMSFYDRRPTGEVATIYTDTTDVNIDPVTSRIIWLKGMEESNRTSYWRFIYIHGTHEEGLIGTAQSKGCIRMRNEDVIELFDLVREGMFVNIIEPGTIRSGEKE
jgi:hypothetical protein